MAALQIRSDIQHTYASLFGEKPVNGRTLVVEEVIERLVQAIGGELQELLAARYVFQEQVARSGARYDFLPPGEKVSDADGHTATVESIRRGMLDGFFGRSTPDAWRLNPTVPIPADTMRPGLEGTGPGDRSRHGDERAQHRRRVVDVGLGRRRRRLQGPAVSRVAEPARHPRAQVGRHAVRASGEEADLQDRRAVRDMADDLPSRAGPAPAQSADLAGRGAGARRSCRRWSSTR